MPARHAFGHRPRGPDAPLPSPHPSPPAPRRTRRIGAVRRCAQRAPRRPAIRPYDPRRAPLTRRPFTHFDHATHGPQPHGHHPTQHHPLHRPVRRPGRRARPRPHPGHLARRTNHGPHRGHLPGHRRDRDRRQHLHLRPPGRQRRRRIPSAGQAGAHPKHLRFRTDRGAQHPIRRNAVPENLHQPRYLHPQQERRTHAGRGGRQQLRNAGPVPAPDLLRLRRHQRHHHRHVQHRKSQCRDHGRHRYQHVGDGVLHACCQLRRSLRTGRAVSQLTLRNHIPYAAEFVVSEGPVEITRGDQLQFQRTCREPVTFAAQICDIAPRRNLLNRCAKAESTAWKRINVSQRSVAGNFNVKNEINIYGYQRYTFCC